MQNWEASGLCYTYNPPRPLSSGKHWQFYSYLSFKDQNNFIFRGFKIFLHEKGQFWPGNMEIEAIGSKESIYLDNNMEISGIFKLKQKTLLNRETSPCEIDEDYSFTKCVLLWVAQEAGCHINWITINGINQNFQVSFSNQI